MTNSSSFRQKGGQPGNQNARKHGFYSHILKPDEKRYLARAGTVEGIDQEIAIVRVKLLSILERKPDNVRLMVLALESLARLLAIKYSITKADKKGIQEAVNTVFRDIGLPLGFDFSKETRVPEGGEAAANVRPPGS